MARIAYLSIPQVPQWFEAFSKGLAERGYVEGTNIQVRRYTAPTNTDLPAFAEEISRGGFDLIVTVGTPASLAARNAARTTPIVFTLVADPLAVGLVDSLARPGGSITGNSNQGQYLVPKQLQILKELVVGLRRLAVLIVPADPASALARRSIETSAPELQLEPVFVDFVEGREFAEQLKLAFNVGAQAVLQPSSTYFNPVRTIEHQFLVEGGLVSLTSGVTQGASPPFVGLASYSASNTGVIRRAAYYVDAILRGATPAALPVELPTEFDFGISLPVARAIGFSVPSAIIAQATLLIE